MTAFKARRAITAILPAVTSLAAAAKCGGVDYTMGAEALARMHDFVVTMMMYEIFRQNHTHISYLQIKLEVFINHL